MARLGDLFPNDLQPKPAGGKAGKPAAPAAGQNARAPKNAASNAAERTFVKDLASGQEVDGTFLVMDASIRVAKNGSKYVQATLCDKTGSMPLRQWDATEVDFGCYKVSGYVKVRGRVETYKNAMQMIAFAVQECSAEGINAADFLPVSSRPLEEMEKELDALLGSFTDPDYKRLINAIFSDPALRGRFLKSPAATNVHHAWVSGLLEHVLSASKTAQSVAEHRPFLNRDLLLAGVLLHDVGKIEELDPGPGFGYTDTGRLCGHIALGALLVERAILKLENFPPRKRDLILHLILSHHGTHEFGSPVLPATAEATALHHIECLDAKVQGMQTIIEKERDSGNETNWTDFARVADGRIYKG